MENTKDLEIISKLPEVQSKNISSIAYLTFMEDPRFNTTQKFVWLHLDARAGKNRFLYFGRNKYANTLGLSKTTYNDALAVLSQHNAIIIFERYSKKDGNQDSSIILVCDYNQMTGEFYPPENIKELYEEMQTLFSEYNIVIFRSKRKIKAKKTPLQIEKEKIEKQKKKSAAVDKSIETPPSNFDTPPSEIDTPPNQNLTPSETADSETPPYQILTPNNIYINLFIYNKLIEKVIHNLELSIQQERILRSLIFVSCGEDKLILQTDYLTKTLIKSLYKNTLETLKTMIYSETNKLFEIEIICD